MKRNSTKNGGIFPLLIALCFALLTDLISKKWLFGREQTVIPGVLALTPVQNTGVSFGFLQGSIWAIGLSLFMLLCVMIFCIKTKPGGAFAAFIGLMIGGALGNLADRLLYGYVRDMLEILFIDFPVFNLGDVFVCLGAFLMAIYILFFDKGGQKNA